MDGARDSGAQKKESWTDPIEQAMGDFVRGAFHSTVECPTNGVVQLANLGVVPLTGQRICKLDITNLEEDLKNGEANILAVEAGGAVGSAALFYAANKFGAGGKQTMAGAKLVEYGGMQSLKTSLLNSAKHGAVSGVIWGTVFTQSRRGDDFWNVLAGRAENGIQCGLAFGGSAAASEATRYGLSQSRLLGTMNQRRFLSTELPLVTMAGGATGAGTGLINANLDSLIHEHRLASGGEMAHRALSDGVMGMSFSAAHQVHSHYSAFKPIDRADARKLSWVQPASLQEPELQSFYSKNQSPLVRQPISALTDPDRDLAVHVTRFPNNRIAGLSIDQRVLNGGKDKSLYIGEDAFAPEIVGTETVFGHLNLLQRRLIRDAIDNRAASGVPPENYIGRVIVKPDVRLRDHIGLITTMDAETRTGYGGLFGVQLERGAFPIKIQHGPTTPETKPLDAEVLVTSVQDEMAPPSRLSWHDAETVWKAIKHESQDVPPTDPAARAEKAEFGKQWRYHEDVRAEAFYREKLRDVVSTKLEDFHKSPYGEILGRANRGFAGGITFDATSFSNNAEEKKK